MRHYQRIYDESVSNVYNLRQNYLNIQDDNDKIKEFDRFKKVKKDIWYFYLIAIVVVAVVLLIVCVRKTELFSKIWVIYFVLLALNSALMAIVLSIFKQILEQKAAKTRETIAKANDEAIQANEDLAKLCVCLTVLDKNSCYLASISEDFKRKITLEKLIYEYKNIINEKYNEFLTTDDAIGYYKEQIIAKEK